MRELLCVPQSSKERLRRSRTESSGAAPATEELAGEARQVRPEGPHADSYQPGIGGEVWRASDPPVPVSNIFLRKFNILSTSCSISLAEAGIELHTFALALLAIEENMSYTFMEDE